jgi:hypothetical protein
LDTVYVRQTISQPIHILVAYNRMVMIGLKPSAHLLAILLSAWTLFGQPATRLYVEPATGADQSTARLHDEFVQQLRKRKDFVVVARPEDADKLVSVTGEVHIKGYLGRNIRLRYVNSDSQPVYGGYLSIELKTPDDQPVWSWLATPRRLGPEDINRNLTEQALRRLADFLATPTAAGKP